MATGDNARLDKIEETLHELERNQAVVVQTLQEVKATLERLADLNERLVKHETRLDGVKQELAAVREEVNELRKKSTTHLLWLIGVLGGLAANLIIMLTKAHGGG